MRQQSSQIFEDLSIEIDISKNVNPSNNTNHSNNDNNDDGNKSKGISNNVKNINSNNCSASKSQVSHYQIAENLQLLSRSRSEVNKGKVERAYLMSPMQQLSPQGKVSEEKVSTENQNNQNNGNKQNERDNNMKYKATNTNKQIQMNKNQHQTEQQQQANVGGWICEDCLNLRKTNRTLRYQITTLQQKLSQNSSKLSKYVHDVSYLSKQGIKYAKLVMELEGKLRECQGEVGELRKKLEGRNQRYIIIEGEEYFPTPKQKQQQNQQNNNNEQKTMPMTKKPSLTQNRRGRNPSSILSDQQQILDSLIKQFETSKQELQQKSKQNLTIQQTIQKHLINYVIQLNKGTKAKIKDIQNGQNNSRNQSQIEMENAQGIKDYIQIMLDKQKERVKEFVDNFNVMIGDREQQQKQSKNVGNGNQETWCAYRLIMNMLRKKS